MSPANPNRNRLACAAAMVLIVLAGLAIRADAIPLPNPIKQYAPDALWALLVYVFALLLCPRLQPWRAAAYAFSFAFAIECSQLYQAPWLNSLRSTRIGGLVLGHGFLWSDLICYAAGIVVGAMLDCMVRNYQFNRVDEVR